MLERHEFSELVIFGGPIGINLMSCMSGQGAYVDSFFKDVLGNVCIGDLLWSVNGVSVHNVVIEEIRQIIKNSPSPITLLFKKLSAFRCVAVTDNDCGEDRQVWQLLTDLRARAWIRLLVQHSSLEVPFESYCAAVDCSIVWSTAVSLNVIDDQRVTTSIADHLASKTTALGFSNLVALQDWIDTSSKETWIPFLQSQMEVQHPVLLRYKAYLSLPEDDQDCDALKSLWFPYWPLTDIVRQREGLAVLLIFFQSTKQWHWYGHYWELSTFVLIFCDLFAIYSAEDVQSLIACNYHDSPTNEQRRHFQQVN
jgi:hypothetical protein